MQRLNCIDHLQCRCIVTYYQGEQKGFLGYARTSARAKSFFLRERQSKELPRRTMCKSALGLCTYSVNANFTCTITGEMRSVRRKNVTLRRKLNTEHILETCITKLLSRGQLHEDIRICTGLLYKLAIILQQTAARRSAYVQFQVWLHCLPGTFFFETTACQVLGTQGNCWLLVRAT